jgi:hypothetical protein
MPVLQIRRGNIANLPAEAGDGELLLVKDTADLYAGMGTGLSPVKLTDKAPAASHTTGSDAIAVATDTTNGLMSSSDFTKLAGLGGASSSLTRYSAGTNVNVLATGTGVTADITGGNTLSNWYIPTGVEVLTAQIYFATITGTTLTVNLPTGWGCGAALKLPQIWGIHDYAGARAVISTFNFNTSTTAITITGLVAAHSYSFSLSF